LMGESYHAITHVSSVFSMNFKIEEFPISLFNGQLLRVRKEWFNNPIFRASECKRRRI